MSRRVVVRPIAQEQEKYVRNGGLRNVRMPLRDAAAKDGYVMYAPGQFSQWKADAEHMGDKVVEMYEESPNEAAGSGPWSATTKNGGRSGEFVKGKGGHLQKTVDAAVVPPRLSGPKPVGDALSKADLVTMKADLEAFHDFEHGTHGGEAKAPTYRHKTSGKEIVSVKPPGADWEKVHDAKDAGENSREARTAAETLIGIDNRIWNRFGWKSGGQVNNNWDKYKAAVAAAVPSSYSQEVGFALEDENFHSMYRALRELGKIRAGDAKDAPGTASGIGGPDNFNEWMRLVDTACETKAGVSVHDLPDCPFRDWFESSVTPAVAADRCIRQSRSAGRDTQDDNRKAQIKGKITEFKNRLQRNPSDQDAKEGLKYHQDLLEHEFPSWKNADAAPVVPARLAGPVAVGRK